MNVRVPDIMMKYKKVIVLVLLIASVVTLYELYPSWKYSKAYEDGMAFEYGKYLSENNISIPDKPYNDLVIIGYYGRKTTGRYGGQYKNIESWVYWNGDVFCDGRAFFGMDSCSPPSDPYIKKFMEGRAFVQGMINTVTPKPPLMTPAVEDYNIGYYGSLYTKNAYRLNDAMALKYISEYNEIKQLYPMPYIYPIKKEIGYGNISGTVNTNSSDKPVTISTGEDSITNDITIGNNTKATYFNGHIDDFTISPRSDFINSNESWGNLTSVTITMSFKINDMILYKYKNISISTTDCGIPIVSGLYYNITGNITNGLKNVTCQEINVSEYQPENVSYSQIDEIKIFDKPKLSLWEKIWKKIN